jgi:FHA domain
MSDQSSSNHRRPLLEEDDTSEFQIKVEQERLRQAVEEHLMRRSVVDRARELLRTHTNLITHQAVAKMSKSTPVEVIYAALPESALDNLEAHRKIWWRIQLRPSESRLPILGLDLYGDVIFGRGGDPAAQPDLDLERYGAMNNGVSRQHVLLHPTEQRLYLTDLGSSNGTRWNSVKLGRGQAQILSHNDIISFGNAVFQVSIIRSPSGGSTVVT